MHAAVAECTTRCRRRPRDPDLSGVWMAFAAIAPDGGFAPKYSADGQATLDAYSSQFKQIPETGAFCVPGGMPGVMLTTVSYPIEIVQTRRTAS